MNRICSVSRLVTISALFLCFSSLSFAAPAGSVDSCLQQGSRLASAKRFADAEALYREAIRRFPQSRNLKLELGRVLMWEGKYAEAETTFASLLRVNPRDTEARRELATAYYWSGDYRNAQREFEQVLRSNPRDEMATRSVAEIRSTTAPGYSVGATAIHDDQPYDFTRIGASLFFFSDPLTRWTVGGGTQHMKASDLGLSGNAPFVEVSGETLFPSSAIALKGSVRALRFADDTTRPLFGLSVERRFTGALVLALRFQQDELLRTASSLKTHPYQSAVTAAAERLTGNSWTGAAHLSRLRYFDQNNGTAADAWMLQPVVRGSAVTVSLGASAAYRDTDESRFVLQSASAVRVGNEFQYSYEGAYDPYWTPQKLSEARLIGAMVWKGSHATLNLHLDGGISRDRVLSFGPSSGLSPTPPLAPGDFQRTAHPWRASADLTIPFNSKTAITLGAERNSTPFYRSNEVHAALAGRF